MLSGTGAPVAPPDPADAWATYYDDTPGNIWTWNGTTWTDTGIPVNGNDGADGTNAFTFTTAPFVMPGANGGSPVVVNVVDTTWMVDTIGGFPGQPVYVRGAGIFTVGGIISATQVILINLRDDAAVPPTYQGNAAPATVIATDAQVAPSGFEGPEGPDGEAATIAVGTTTTLAAGNPATVTNAGTALAAIFDFGIPTGPTGTAGHTPVLTVTSTGPTGGVEGDWHIEQVNPGFLRIYYNDGSGWVGFVNGNIVSNRLLGTSNSNPTPNPAGLPANAGDQWWTQIGTTITQWVYNGTSWAVGVTFTTGGGGGADTLTTVIANSIGQLSGPLAANWQRTNFNVAFSHTHTVPGNTYQFDTNYAYHDVTLNTTPITLNYVDPPSGYYSEWVVMLTNATAAQVDINYTANQWKKDPGVTHPVILNATESALVHCYYYKGYMWISAVDQNGTII